MTNTETTVQNLKINKLTKAQYDNITPSSTEAYELTDLSSILDSKQATLVSGTNIKTINNTNLLGSGNIDIQGGGTATDVKINNTSITNNGIADIKTNGTYNSSSNKIATMSDLPTVPTKVSDLTNDAGYTSNAGTVTSVNNVSPVNGNVSLTIPSITIQDITTLSNGTISLTNACSLYKHTPSGATTYTFSTGNLSLSSSVAYTFELCVVMSTVYGLTFPNTVTWLNNETPDLSATGTYFLVFRTIDGGSTWLGNLQGKW